MKDDKITMIAESAIRLLRQGIYNDNLNMIKESLKIVDHDSFSWKDIEVIKMEWDELLHKLNI